MCIRTEWDTFVCLHADAVTPLKADLLPFPWSGVRLNQSSCVYSLFLRLRNPAEEEEGKINDGNGKRAAKTPAYDSENWTTRRWGENDSLSSLCLSLHHSDPLKVGTSRCPVGNLSSSCPSVAPRPPCTKRAHRAIWLWVMEGGLNSPSEILEPVGKPQLFKCRKSWFYKMLTWSAQGTGEQNGWEKEAPSINPHHHLFEDREQRERGGGGLWQKRGKLKRIIIMRRWRGCGKGPHLFWSNHVITLHLLPDLHKQASLQKRKRDDKTTQYGPHFLCTSEKAKLSLQELSMHSECTGKWNSPFISKLGYFTLRFLQLLWLCFSSP